MSFKNLATSLATVLALAAPASLAQATDWTVKSDASTVGFLAVGKPGFLKIRGEGAKLAGSASIVDGKLTGTFEVGLADLKTGIDMRDEHMKEKYLEVGKHPKALLVVDPLAVASGEGEYEFGGKLTVKGVEKPVSGKLNLDLGSDKATGSAEFTIKLSDYPIGVPSHLGVSVAETVDVKVTFVAAPR